MERDHRCHDDKQAASRRDAKNVPLQYVLADRYRETGENDKAEALYKELLSSRPTPQTYRALASSLLKRKKAAASIARMTPEKPGPNSTPAHTWSGARFTSPT